MRALADVNSKVSWDAMKGFMRDWAKATRRTMKRFAPKAKGEYNRYLESGKGSPRRGAGKGRFLLAEPSGMLRKSINYRIKRYRSKRAIWVGVGGSPSGRDTKISGYHPAGWRAHFAEGGTYNKMHRRYLGRTRFRTKTFEATKMYGQEQIEAGVRAALRAGGFA